MCVFSVFFSPCYLVKSEIMMSGIENSVILSAVKAKFNFDFVPEHVKHKHTHTELVLHN